MNEEAKKLLEKCDKAYWEGDFKKLIRLCDEVSEIDPDNPGAIGYKGISLCFLNKYDEALKILKKGCRLYPNNYYIKNNLSMVYYDLGEYENSLKCSEEGLKIKDFDWLWENKIKALIKLDRVDEAMECYENSPHRIEIANLLIEAGKYSEAFEYLYEDMDDFEAIIDKIKEQNTDKIGDYYISWIYKIKSKSDIRVCVDCGGELIPIVWGLPHSGLIEKSERGEIVLGGCCLPPNPPNYQCKNCNKQFDLGFKGLHIECDDYLLNEYIEYKISEFTSSLKGNSIVFIKSLKSIKDELKGFNDEEFNAFINHLKDLNYICEPREGYIKLVGYDDFKCAKEYLDEGKFAAPRWLAFPQFSAGTMCWRMGVGEDYAMNHPHHSKEYLELFPMPKYWQFSFSESPYGPHPPIGYFWNKDGKPKYPMISEGIEVNDFITLDDEKEFHADTFTFKSIEHAVSISKYLYFEKHGSNDDDLDDFEFTSDEEKTWDIYRYSVLLNAAYFKVMQDENLKKKLLETGDEPLIYVSDDNQNLFGRALMELRDEIRRICANEDLIDWEYSEYLKYKPWW